MVSIDDNLGKCSECDNRNFSILPRPSELGITLATRMEMCFAIPAPCLIVCALVGRREEGMARTGGRGEEASQGRLAGGLGFLEKEPTVYGVYVW